MNNKGHSRQSTGPDLCSQSLLSKPFSTQSSPSVNFYGQHPLAPKSQFENKEFIKKVDRTPSIKYVKEKKESKNEMLAKHPTKTIINPEALFGDVSFLNKFKDKMMTKEKEIIISKEVGGRYSLLDRDLKTVDTASHVITELWKLPADKSLNCLMGQMESFEKDLSIGEETDASSDFPGQISKPIVKPGNSLTDKKRAYISCFKITEIILCHLQTQG